MSPQSLVASSGLCRDSHRADPAHLRHPRGVLVGPLGVVDGHRHIGDAGEGGGEPRVVDVLPGQQTAIFW